VKFRRKPRENIEINLASLLDVVFILLLFFVVSSTFNREAQLKVELPQAESAEVAQENGKHLEISIAADGSYALNGQALVKSDLATLSSALQRESAGDSSLPLVISADARTAHQAVVTAMDAAGKLGFSRLRITTVEAAPAKP
jgi:biopolymer transport protein ExbD